MDNFYPYDETFEEFERRTGLDKFFGEFSSEVRNKLIIKNLERPTDVYDVLYPNTRANLQAKNIPKKLDLEKDSEEIRNGLLSKHVEKQIGLEESGELTRNSLLSKNKLVESSKNLEEIGEESRKLAVAKNQFFKEAIDKIASEARSLNVNKNVNNNKDLLSSSELDRQYNLSKNSVEDNDPYNKKIELDSADYLANNLLKNKNKTTDLESQSDSIRKGMLSQNKASSISEENNLNLSERNAQLSRNVSNASDLEKSSENIRKNNISKNEETFTNLDDISANIRQDNIAKNNIKNTDLELDSDSYRRNNVLNNNEKTNDLDEQSKIYRNLNINNNVKNENDLDKQSENYREDNLFKNNEVKTNLENLGATIRRDNLSKNVSSESDLEKNAEIYRQDSLSFNTKNKTDLEEISSSFRKEDIQNNVNKNTDLESDSVPYRQDDLSFNIAKNTDLESDSIPYRQDDLSFNLPINSDLESDSVNFRSDDLSFNSPINSDLESDSAQYRQEDLSANVPIQSNLSLDSAQYRQEDLSSNVPNGSNLELDSIPFRQEDLSSNVPIGSDLELDSIQTLGENLAHNVSNFSDLQLDSIPFRQDDLAANVSNNFDLGLESIPFRNEDLAANVSNSFDLIGFSQQERHEQLAQNANISSDLESISSIFRNEQLAKNPSRFSLGANINLVNTSFYVGLSNLEIQSAIFREANKLLNRASSKNALPNVFDDEQSIEFFNEISSNQPLPGGREYLLLKNTNSSLNIIDGKENLAGTYGTNLSDDSGKSDNGIDVFSKPKIQGHITNTIALHNIQQNTFQSRPGYTYESGSQSALEDLRGFNSDGFQNLLSITGVNKRLQRRTNSTPENIISENNGKYLGADAEQLLKVTNDEEPLGTGVSMAAQTNTSDVISKDFDKNGSSSRGVRHIIDTIKKDDRISFAQNFEVQGKKGAASIFILGNNKEGNGYKKSYNRFSIKNPYAPEGAQSMQFSLTNYSIGFTRQRTMAFPAYIKSFQHGDSANWNSTSFLGRPEPIYTYSDSSRDGSISFMVLTDYSQQVDLGYSFDPNSGIVQKVSEDFSNSSHLRKATNSEAKSMEAEIKTLNEKKQQIDTEAQQKLDAGDEAAMANAKKEISELNKQISELENEKDDKSNNVISAQYDRFYETTNGQQSGVNIYKFMEGFQENERDGEYVESKPENTVTKLSEMKSKLMFQPSYFSGSKVDFLERMEFISKLTRPARNTSISDGFSFTKPPVCHIHLGDWFNHDIIINSVSYDYADVPWTLDGGRVQPMWCTVTINFNIIGAYRALRNQDPPLSTDDGGFFSPRR